MYSSKIDFYTFCEMFDFYFPFIIILARTYTTILNRSGKKRHPFLVSYFIRKELNMSAITPAFT